MTTPIQGSDLSNLLRRLVEKAWTGVLYLRSDDNHLIMFGIREGTIVSLSCGPKRGLKAIPLIQELVAGTYHLDPKGILRSDKDMVPTEELLRLMAGEGTARVASVPTDNAAPSTHPAATGATPERVRETLCELLSDYLGPISPVICEEALTAIGGVNSGEQANRVIAHLSRQIDDPDEARSFEASARKQLLALLP